MIDMGRRCVLKYNNSKLVVGFTVGFLVIGFTVFIMLDNRSSHSAKLDTAGNPAGSHQEKTGVVSEASAAAVSPVVSQAPEATSNPVSSSAVPTPDPSPDPAAEPAALKYQGAVEHIFFHPLIAYPELAFDGDSMAKGYNDWFITVKEFAKILDSLYANQYVLIDIHSLYEETEMDGKTIVKAKELWLPPGKKPLVLSIDDLNYYTYMRENGNVYRLVLDDKGEVAAYSVTPQGKELVSHDNEIIPILDDFVKRHPDFSQQGTKGVIALTGYEGILGYRTDQLDSPDYDKAKKDVIPVIERLKETGWSFASHGYGHLDTAKVTYDRFSKDTLRWKKEVEPLIGPTSVYIYPFGSKVLPGDPKYAFLLESGFRMICSVGPAPYLKVRSDSVMMDRRHIDGIAFEDQKKRLLPLFDVNDVIDESRLSQAKAGVK
jgi:hypothetical protein